MRWTALALGLVALSGCGAGQVKRDDVLPAADRVAFYQLGTIDGLIRTHGNLVDSMMRLAALSPRDEALVKLRDELAAATSEAAAGRAAATRQTLDHVYLGLVRYQRAHPAVMGLIPD